MSISNAIATKQQQVAAAYAECNNKGATLPANQNLTNLATCIGTISGGSASSRAFNANYWVDTSGGVHNIGNNEQDTSIGTLLSANATTIPDNAYFSAYENNNAVAKVDLSALTTVGTAGLRAAFFRANNLSVLDLSALTTVGTAGLYQAFTGCQLVSLDLSALTTVGEEGLRGAFQMNKIQTVTFDSLNYIGKSGLFSLFEGCHDYDTDTPTVQSISFPALTSNSFYIDPDSGDMDETAFNYMLADADGATVHFPSNLQAVIGNWQSVTDGFGGYNTTILFDLPATE